MRRSRPPATAWMQSEPSDRIRAIWRLSGEKSIANPASATGALNTTFPLARLQTWHSTVVRPSTSTTYRSAKQLPVRTEQHHGVAPSGAGQIEQFGVVLHAADAGIPPAIVGCVAEQIAIELDGPARLHVPLSLDTEIYQHRQAIASLRSFPEPRIAAAAATAFRESNRWPAWPLRRSARAWAR